MQGFARPVRLAGQRLRRRPDKCDAGRRPSGRRISRPAASGRTRALHCAAAMFALCGLNIPSAGTHATPAPNRAHSGSHAETRRVLRVDGDDVFGSGSSTPSTLFRQIRRSPLLLRKDTVMPFLLRVSTLLRIRWEKLLGVSPSIPAGSIFSNNTLAGALISGCRRSSSERRKRILSLGCFFCSQSSDSSFQT